MNKSTFPIILINGRPAAGKSEIIDYLKNTSPAERIKRFHINQYEVFDDFPILWSWFEEDGILEELGYPKLHSNDDGYFSGQHLWHVLVKRLCLEYKKKLRDNPAYHTHHTAIIEFSRGSEHGGYNEAYKYLSPEVLKHAAIMYINVSWEESYRKNKSRFNPDKPDSILEHGMNEGKITRLYKEDDWMSLSKESGGYLSIQRRKIPYAVFENENDVTTPRGKALGHRLEETLQHLWDRYIALRNEP